MWGLVVVVTVGVLWWAVQFFRDRGSVEHLVLREEAIAVLAGAIEQAGERVLDISLLRDRGIRWNVLWGSFAFGAGYLVAALLVALGIPVLPVALLLAVLFGGVGALDNFGNYLIGRDDLSERRDGRERLWFLLAVATKSLATFAACWLYLTGVASLRPGWAWGAVAFVVVGLALLTQCHQPAVWCLRRGRQHRTVGFALEADRESILLLRSFDDDALTLRSTVLAGSIGTPTLPTARIRFEEYLVWILKLFGSVVAIGRPGESLPELGAVRTYWSDDQWQDAVRQTAMRSRGIVMIAGSGEGLRWEMERLRAWGLLSKTLIVLPPDPDAQSSLRRFDRAIEQISPGGTAVREYFLPAAWTGLTVDADGTLRHHIADGRDWAAYAATVASFFGQLRGQLDPVADGMHARLLDQIQRIASEASTVEDALAQLDAEGTVVPARRTRKRYAISRVERPTPGQAVRLARGLGQLADLTQPEMGLKAIPALDGLIAGLDLQRTPVIVGVLLNQKGELALELPDLDLADAAFLEADQIAGTGSRQANLLGSTWTPEEVRAEALRGRRKVAHARGDVEAALSLDADVAAMCDEAGDRAGMLDAAVESAELLLTGEDHVRSAAQFAATAQLARTLGDTIRLRWALWRLANLQERLGDLDASLTSLRAAAEVAENRGEVPQSVSIRTDAARVLMALGRPGDAWTALVEAAKWAEAIAADGERERCVRAVLKALDALPGDGHPDPAELRAHVRDIQLRRALAGLRERLSVAESAGDAGGQAALQVEIAMRLTRASHPHEAALHWSAALTLARTIGANDVVDEATRSLAAAQGAAGDVDGAVRTLTDSSRRKNGLGDSRGAGLDLVNAGNWYLRSRRWVEGLAVLDRAWATGLEEVRREVRVTITHQAWRDPRPTLEQLGWRLHAEEWLAARGEHRPGDLRRVHFARAAAMADTDPDAALGELATARTFTASTSRDGERLLDEWTSEDDLAVRILTDAGRREQARSVAAEAVGRLRAQFAETPGPHVTRRLVRFLDLLAVQTEPPLRRPLYEELLAVSAHLSPDGEQNREEQADWRGWAWGRLARLSSGPEAAEFARRSAHAYRFCARLGDARATLQLARSLHRLAHVRRFDQPDEAYLAALEGLDRLACQDGVDVLRVRAALAAVAFDLTHEADPTTAEQFARTAVLASEARLAHADTPSQDDGLACAFIALGDARIASPRLASVAAYAAAVVASETGDASHPDDQAGHYRSVALTRLARALRVTQPADATVLLREALARVLARHEQRPRDPGLWLDLASVLHNLACAELQDNPEAAMGHWSESRAYAGLVLTARPESAEASELLLLVQSHLHALSKSSSDKDAVRQSS